MTSLKSTGYAFLALLLCGSVIAGAPIADRLAQLSLVRARMHLRTAWRAVAPLAMPGYTDTPAHHAIHIDEPQRPPSIAFVNGHIDRFTLDELRGYGVLLFFSSRECDGPCIYVLKQFAHVKAALGAYAARVRFVIVGVDAEHDRSPSLLRVVRSYDPDFMALTADAQIFAQFARKHGATILRTPRGTHGAPVLLAPYIVYLNPEGFWTMCFPPDMPAEEIADEIIYSLAF